MDSLLFVHHLNPLLQYNNLIEVLLYLFQSNNLPVHLSNVQEHSYYVTKHTFSVYTFVSRLQIALCKLLKIQSIKSSLSLLTPKQNTVSVKSLWAFISNKLWIHFRKRKLGYIRLLLLKI